MNRQALVLRIAARAYQAASARQDAKMRTHPVNKPHGIKKDIVDEHGRGVADPHDETTSPARKDVRPEDVFAGTPAQMNVRNFAETGKDQSRAIEKQTPKDKGYETVSNLSQYLIMTEGGGAGGPAGRKL